MCMLVMKFSRSKFSTPPLYCLRILSTKNLCNNIKYVTCTQEFLPSNEESSDQWQGFNQICTRGSFCEDV